MHKRIIYSNEQGGVSIVIPAPNSEITLQELVTKVVPQGVAYKIVDVSEIPTDRTFRDAWEYQE